MLSIVSCFLLSAVCILCFCFPYCIYVVLFSAQSGGSNGIEAQSLGPLFLQCFDTVGWVFWPIKPVPDMTYNVFGGMLNLAQFNSIPAQCHSSTWSAAGFWEQRDGFLMIQMLSNLSPLQQHRITEGNNNICLIESSQNARQPQTRPTSATQDSYT